MMDTQRHGPSLLDLKKRMDSDPEFARQVYLKRAQDRRVTVLLQLLSYRGGLKDMQRYGRSPEREEGIKQYIRSYQLSTMLPLRQRIQELLANAPLP